MTNNFSSKFGQDSMKQVQHFWTFLVSPVSAAVTDEKESRADNKN